MSRNATPGTTHRGPIRSIRGFESIDSIHYFEDFIGAGAVVIPAAGSAESGMDWGKGITGAAPPTVAGVADVHGGMVACTLTSASQAQSAALYHADQRNFDVRKGGFIEMRVIPHVLPTDIAKLVFGLGKDHAADADGITHSIWFAITSAGLLVETDDSSTDNSIDTLLNPAADDVIACRIDFTDLADIRFYVAINPTVGKEPNWSRVASGTTFAFSDATADDNHLQPYFAACKASGTGVGTLYVDALEINVYKR